MIIMNYLKRIVKKLQLQMINVYNIACTEKAYTELDKLHGMEVLNITTGRLGVISIEIASNEMHWKKIVSNLRTMGLEWNTPYDTQKDIISFCEYVDELTDTDGYLPHSNCIYLDGIAIYKTCKGNTFYYDTEQHILGFMSADIDGSEWCWRQIFKD